MTNQQSYSPGHPWYYKLGGGVHKPKQILAAVTNDSYQGYMADDIKQADGKHEPQRTSALRNLREAVIIRLHADLERYREVVCDLRRYRITNKQEVQPICSDVHTSMSLKYNHLYNDFAHLVYIDDLLSQQPDLFGF